MSFFNSRSSFKEKRIRRRWVNVSALREHMGRVRRRGGGDVRESGKALMLGFMKTPLLGGPGR